MLNKFFRLAFGLAGDRVAVPDATQPDGSVSYNTGYTPPYQANPLLDPTAKNIERDKMNQVLFDVTTGLQEYQVNGAPDWITNAQNGGVAYPYPQWARVRYTDGKIYVSTKAANTSLPTVSPDWFEESGRLLRVTRYLRIAGVQNISVNGGPNTTTGATLFTKLLGMKYAIIDVNGGGGGGGGGVNPTAGNVGLGAPGACGGYGRGLYLSAAIGVSEAVVVGNGGAGGIGGAGGGGSTSSVGSIISAGGGGGGLSSGAGGVAVPSLLGQSSASGSVVGANLIAYGGVPGVPSIAMAATTVGAYGGNGGGTVFGPTTSFSGANANGTSATVMGAGGSGVAILNGAGPANGGDGAAGVVFIYEYE